MFKSMIDKVKKNLSSKTTFTTGASRQNKQVQKKIRDTIDNNHELTVYDVNSSRWKYGNDPSLLTSDEVSAKDIANQNTDEKIKEVQTRSTAVEKVKYNPKTEMLTVKYRSGDINYDFPDVPKEVVEEFLDAPSKGKYMAHVIRPEYSTNK